MTNNSIMPTYVNELITPERAEQLLELNIGNRPIKRTAIDAMAQAMAEGRFQPNNGDTLRVTVDNTLVDGQNRLYAVIKSGVAQMMTVAYNVPRGAVSSIDQGTPRNVRDILILGSNKVPNINAAEAVVRILTGLSRGTETLRRDRTLVAQYLVDHQEELNPWVEFGTQVAREAPSTPIQGSSRRRRRSISASALAALCVHMERQGADPATMRLFFDGVGKGFNMEAQDMQALTPERVSVLQAVHRRLTNGIPLSRTNSGNHEDVLIEYAVHIMAYNRFVNNEKMLQPRSLKAVPKRLEDLPEPTTEKVSIPVAA